MADVLALKQAFCRFVDSNPPDVVGRFLDDAAAYFRRHRELASRDEPAPETRRSIIPAAVYEESSD